MSSPTQNNRKRSLQLSVETSPPEKRYKRSLNAFQQRITFISGGPISKEPYATALKNKTITISELPLTCVKGASDSFFLDSRNKKIPSAIIKPAFWGHSETSLWGPSERIAYLISKELNLGVPKTVLGRIPAKHIPNSGPVPPTQPIICSIQDFRFNMQNAHTCTEETQLSILQSKSPQINRQVRKTIILDILLANADRRPRNLLVDAKEPIRNIVPIDHSLILDFKKTAKFFFLHANTSKKNFTNTEKKWIQRISYPGLKRTILQDLPETPDHTLKTLETTIKFLKIGSSLELTPFELGGLMHKDTYQDSSFIEYCFNKAKTQPGKFSKNISTVLTEEMQSISSSLKQARTPILPPIFPLPLDPRSQTLVKITDAVNYTPEGEK